jgi:hypothetical protein
VPQRCPGHVTLIHIGWHKILWCNEKGLSGRKLSLHQPLAPSGVSFSFWCDGNQRKFWRRTLGADLSLFKPRFQKALKYNVKWNTQALQR